MGDFGKEPDRERRKNKYPPSLGPALDQKGEGDA
jgi:hypothetical protein